MIGVVMAAYAAASFVIRAILPGLVRKLDEDRVLSYSLFLSGGTFLLFPFFQDVYLLSLISFILGLGLGCGQPLSIMLTYNRSPQGRSGEALGMRLTVNKLTQIMIPLVFGSIGSAFGLFPVFWGNAFLLLAGGYASVRKIHAEGSEFFEEKGKEG
jgi:MFS family permease